MKTSLARPFLWLRTSFFPLVIAACYGPYYRFFGSGTVTDATNDQPVKGIEVTEESLALDVIKSIGPGGHYLTHDHTLENMRSEFFYPLSADRQTFSGWTSDGSPDGRTKAGQIARSLLAMHRPKPVDVEAGILSGIPGMVQDWMD